MSPFVQPTATILVGGNPIIEECVAENTGASDDLKPGMLCIKGTADHQVKYAGAAAVNVVGVADIDGVHPKTTAYVEGKNVRVLKGPCVVLLTLANGESVAKGDKLIAAATGECAAFPATPAAGDEEKIIGIAEETVDASGGAASIMVRLI